MKAKKVLAIVMILCLLFCGMSMTALAAEVRTIAVGEAKTVTVTENGEVTYSFTPEESGTYMFAAGYDESLETFHMVMLSTVTAEGEVAEFDQLYFEAEAGQTYELVAGYVGNYTEAVEYTFFVEKCSAMEGIELYAESDTGNAEEYLYVELNYLPEYSIPEAVTWETSDSSVAEISYEDSNGVDLYLVAPGTATITATTASGLSASIEITVEEAEVVVELIEGENTVRVPGGELAKISFTPENSGYYSIELDGNMAGLWMDADALTYENQQYFALVAGESYDGEIYGWSEEDMECTVTVVYHEDLVILEPTAIELVSLPDNITYLASTLEELWNDGMLSGMVLRVTWSDNSVTEWDYDENYGHLGTGYVGGFLNEKEDGGYEVEVYVSAAEVAPVFFDLTVLDITAESIALVDETPLQIVEHSCGMDLGSLGLGVEGWYYFPFAAYNREVVITFSDGSTVNAKPGDVVYGMEILCQDNQGGVVVQTSQPEGFWTKDSENLVGYVYGDLYAMLTVEIIDSPVESIEVSVENDTFMVDEELGLIGPDGEPMETVRDLLNGLSVTVHYKDGTTKTFAAEDVEWRTVMDMEYPFVDGYPVGIFGGDWMMEEVPEVPGEIEGYVEYMGVSTTYTIHLVEGFEDDDDTDKPIEINPETGDKGMLLAVLVIAFMSAAVIIIKNEKLIA